MSTRFILTIIFIIAAVIVGYFLAWPEYQKIIALQRGIENVKLKIDQDKDYFNELKKIDNQLKQNKDKIAIVDSILPDEFYLPHLFYALRKIVLDNNLQFQSISVSISPFEESNRINKIQVGLEVSGSYSNFKEFLYHLERSTRLFSIDNVRVNPSLYGDSFNFDLSITTFSYK